MNPLEIIERYYEKDSHAYNVLVQHSRNVTKKALEVAKRVPELTPDLDFIEEAAMLHDIGVIRTHAPKMGCHGEDPYIQHGIIGAEMLREEDLPKHARVCERHLGTGIGADEIRRQGLPLPEEDFVPETLEEEIICFADLFFSKVSRDIDDERTVEEVKKALEPFGAEGVREFENWCRKFKEV